MFVCLLAFIVVFCFGLFWVFCCCCWFFVCLFLGFFVCLFVCFALFFAVVNVIALYNVSPKDFHRFLFFSLYRCGAFICTSNFFKSAQCTWAHVAHSRGHLVQALLWLSCVCFLDAKCSHDRQCAYQLQLCLDDRHTDIVVADQSSDLIVMGRMMTTMMLMMLMLLLLLLLLMMMMIMMMMMMMMMMMTTMTI